jgi:hypothetical protein
LFVFDVETLGKQSTTTILSMAAVYFDPDKDITYDELVASAFFVKFDAQDQIKRLKRGASKSTMEWWSKQCEVVRNKSFKPSKDDVKFEDGYDLFRQWAKSIGDNKCWVFARGNLDQLVLDDIEEQLGLDPVFPFSRWRDVRTAVDFLCGTNNGYASIPNFDPQSSVFKHDPVHDVAYDALMLKYGEKKS